MKNRLIFIIAGIIFIAALAVGIFYAGYRLLPVVTEKEAES